MTRWRSRRLLFTVLLLHAAATMACARRTFEEFQHQNAEAAARSLYAPLIEGQLRLASTLEAQDQQSVVFALSPGSARPLNVSARAADLRDPSSAVFFRLLDPSTGSATAVACLDPATLALESLDDRGGNAWVRSADGRIIVLRSLAVPARLPFTRPRRALFRFDFTLDDARNIVFDQAHSLTSADGWDIAPVVDPSAGNVVFLRRGDDDRYRLMLTNLTGSPASEVFPAAGFEVRAPRRLDDGRLIFSANPKGYFQLYEMPFPSHGTPQPAATDEASTRSLQPFTGLPESLPGGELLVANTALGDAGDPRILALPAEYDLDAIAALVAARNPAVNRKRALLAATLAEAAQHRFDAWPVLDLAFLYTPVVGVFYDDPEVLSGDFLSEGVARGIFGLAQPLLDFRRVAALTEADMWRAEIARDAVHAEINRRIAEAAELYFEILYRQRRIEISRSFVELADRRSAYFQTLRAENRVTLADVLAATQTRARVQTEAEHEVQRLALARNRLKEVCALPENAPLALTDERFSLADFPLQPIQQLRHVALMNHPDLEAADAALSRAFFQREVGPARRPTAFASGTYGQSRQEDDLGTVLDDFITLTLQGRYPLGSRQVKRLFNEQWDRTIESLGYERDALTRSTSTLIEEVRMDFLVAQRDYLAKRAALDYRAENLRVARVLAEFGAPGEAPRFDPTIEMAAHEEYLSAQASLAEVDLELGIRFARLFRTMGLADRIPIELGPWKASVQSLHRPSLWLWHTKEAMAGDSPLNEFLAFLDAHRPRRLYAYLYSDSLLLDDATDRQKFISLLQFCAARDVEIWALLGEPEWIESRNSAAIDRAIDRILAFNEARPAREARIAGVKLDLEPHSLPGWNSGEEPREALADAYLALLDGARDRLAGRLPLWADLSTQYFKPEQRGFLERLAMRLDGATLMCYFPRADRIRSEGLDALDQFAGPMEVGIELSPNAPADVRVPAMSREALAAFAGDLRDTFAVRPNFAGLALHDYQGILTYFEEGTAVAPGSGPGESSP